MDQNSIEQQNPQNNDSFELSFPPLGTITVRSSNDRSPPVIHEPDVPITDNGFLQYADSIFSSDSNDDQ